MTKTAKDYKGTYTEPALREKLKEEIKANDKGGSKGQWSARKSQLLKAEYEEAGGGYNKSGKLTKEQKNLKDWSKKH